MIWTPDSTVTFPRTTRIIDLNHASPFSAALLDQYGIDGAIVKISQGVSEVDTKAQAFIQILRERNSLIGGYHFTEPNSPKTQAQHFFTSYQRALQVPFDKTRHNITLDLERGTNGLMSLEDAETWVKVIRDLTGVLAQLYGGGGLLRDALENNPKKYANSILLKCPQFLADPRHNWRVIGGYTSFSLRQVAEDDGSGWDYDQFMCPPGQDPRAALHAAWPLMAAA